MLLTVAFALLASQDSATLLPDTPDGWRFERLEFPLTFAPDLEYAGFEELSFAPGMFDAESDSYFSYVLDIELEGDHDLEETWLKAFLESYYLGLCEAVGEDRDPPVDLSDFSVDVRRDGAAYTATIEMVDAFVTGEPMTLELELHTWSGANKTELFGLASPLPKDAEVWKTMRGIRERWEAARALPVLLNRLEFTVDTETFEAMSKSEELSGLFGGIDTRDGAKKPGLSFYGTSTELQVRSSGEAAIVLGVERGKGLETLLEKLAEHDFAAEIVRLGERGMLSVKPAPAEAELAIHAVDQPVSRPLRRDRIVKTVERIGQAEAHAAALVQDVSEVFLELTPADAEYFTAVTKVFGYETSSGPGGVVHIGPQVRFLVTEAKGASRVTGFRLSLRRAVEEKQTITLGKATLSLQGKAATFRYRP